MLNEASRIRNVECDSTFHTRTTFQRCLLNERFFFIRSVHSENRLHYHIFRANVVFFCWFVHTPSIYKQIGFHLTQITISLSKHSVCHPQFKVAYVCEWCVIHYYDWRQSRDPYQFDAGKSWLFSSISPISSMSSIDKFPLIFRS